eukprot:CAMPEP_0183712352 /NCGR_PEP_ID=MMETSP0737-20130205/7497_1 /TAXON_ID=385413 /ORGANISM="Thalassiosira miniscula, Strain CCMP1093" /LENGTH=484 /DNA_ID=CAMNT_0025940949 /DNA_START=23 /DNA_END=1477 /DNA_ORIENTATION=-
MATAGASDGDETQRRERVKARWSMLRQALLGSSSGNDDAGSGNRNSSNNDNKFNEHSMNAFPGFHVIDRSILPREDVTFDCNEAFNECGENWNIVQNSFTSTEGHNVRFLTREVKEQQQNNQESTVQSRMEALLSHRNHGVDNTGNVRVWDAEGTLAGFLLSLVLEREDALKSEGKKRNAELLEMRDKLRSMMIDTPANDSKGEHPMCNLLELGAGQAGLAGLAMAAASLSLESRTDNGKNECTEKTTQMKQLHVVLTDGHPKCVDNNASCAKLMPKSELAKIQIDAQLLLWDSSSNGADACCGINKIIRDPTKMLNGNVTLCNTIDQSTEADGLYHLCLASDCVHFQEFHDGLLCTIARTLVVDGVALMCQPKRGASLQNFMKLVDAVNNAPHSSVDDKKASEALNCCKVTANGPLFHMVLFEDFYPKVSTMHTSLLFGAKHEPTYRYDPDRHQPLLLVLQKLRPYDENIDGELVRHQVKIRA